MDERIKVFIDDLKKHLMGLPEEEVSQAVSYVETLKKSLTLTDTKHLSFHLQCVLGYGQEISSDDFLARFINDLFYIRDVTGLPIHLENTHFYFPCEGKNNNAAFICEPSFIKEALAKADSKFLLDIGHAQIAAWHLGINPIEYIISLSTHLIEEVHITGPIMVGNELETSIMKSMRKGILC